MATPCGRRATRRLPIVAIAQVRDMLVYKRTMSRPSLFVAIPMLLALAGCKPKISADTLEAELIAWLGEQGLSASSASCPDRQKLEGGHMFECTLMVDDVEIPVRVEVTNPTNGVVAWTPKYKTFTREEIEDSVRTLPQFSGRDLDLDCHGTVFLSVPDSTITCNVTDRSSAQSYVATFVFTDDRGSGSWTVDPPAGGDEAPSQAPQQVPTEAPADEAPSEAAEQVPAQAPE